MKLSCLLAAIGLSPKGGDPEVTGIVSDSREIIRDCVFVCIRGEHADGHEYAAAALTRGAAAVICERGRLPAISEDPRFCVTENTRLAYSLLLSVWYGSPGGNMTVVAVTGTNGKTSTVCMLDAIFRAAGYRTGVIGTLCCRIGDRILPVAPAGTHAFTTPDQPRLYRVLSEMAAAGVEYVFMEASSHALAQYRLDGVTVDSAIFTNLSPEHMDFHGDMEHYFDAKARLFFLSRRRIVNVDDKYGRLLAAAFPDSVSYGTRQEADFRALRIEQLGSDGVRYLFRSPSHAFCVNSPIPGQFTAYNTLAAATCALVYGVEPETVMTALRELRGIDGRMEKVKLDRRAGFTVFIDYAHTPEALEGVLSSVREFRRPGQRIILLFGCGGDRDRTKRRAMGRAATRLADLTVITSDNSRDEEPEQIFRDIMRGVDREKPYQIIPDRREAIAYAVSAAQEDDIVLLCGKGHEKYEIDRTGKHPFDENEIVRKAVDTLLK